MPLKFDAGMGCAIDRVNGLELYHTRVEPCSKMTEAEHHFAIYRGSTWHAVACYGLCLLLLSEGNSVRMLTIDLGRDWVLDSLLQLQSKLGIDGTPFDFIHQLAKGMLATFESRTDNIHDVRYLVVAHVTALRLKGVVPPAQFPRFENGDLLLAELRLASRAPLGSDS